MNTCPRCGSVYEGVACPYCIEPPAAPGNAPINPKVKRYHILGMISHLVSLVAVVALIFLLFIPKVSILGLLAPEIDMDGIISAFTDSGYLGCILGYLAILLFGIITPICGLVANSLKKRDIRTATTAYSRMLTRFVDILSLIPLAFIAWFCISNQVGFDLWAGCIWLSVILLALILFISLLKGCTTGFPIKNPIYLKKTVLRRFRERSLNAGLFTIQFFLFFILTALFAYTLWLSESDPRIPEFGTVVYVYAGVFAFMTVASLALAIFYSCIKIHRDKWDDSGITYCRKNSVFCYNDMLKFTVLFLLVIFGLSYQPLTKYTTDVNVNSIDLDMTEEEVSDILGEPSHTDGNTWYYFDRSFEKKFEDAFLSLEDMSSYDDLNEFLEKQYEAQEALIGEKFTYIQIDFDSEKKVCSIFYDKNRIYSDFNIIDEVDCIEFFDKDGNKIDKIDVFETYGNYCLLSDLSDCTAVVHFGNGEFAKFPWFNSELVMLDGEYFFSLQFSEFNALAKIDERISKVDENGICYLEDGLNIITRDMLSSYMSVIKELYIPSSVTRIEADAFLGITSIENLIIKDLEAWCGIEFENENANPIPYAEKVFFEGQIVSNLVIPEGTSKISDYAFVGADFITSVSIPDSVIYMGKGVFNGTYNITEKVNGLNYVDGWLVSCDDSVDSIVFKEDIRGIAALAGFNTVQGLSQITLPESIKTIPEGCFAGCSNLTGVVALGEIKSIGELAFSGCSNLQYVVFNETSNDLNTASNSILLPSTVEEIGDLAFAGCTKIQEISVPAANYIGDRAFDNCSSLVSLSVLGNPDNFTEKSIPANLVRLQVSTMLAKNISKFYANQLIIKGSDEIDGGSEIRKILDIAPTVNYVQIDDVKVIDLDFAVNFDGYSSSFDSINLSVIVGKAAEKVDLYLNYYYQDMSYAVTFEDPEGWSVIDYGFENRITLSDSLFDIYGGEISAADVKLLASYPLELYNYTFKKGELSLFKEVVLVDIFSDDADKETKDMCTVFFFLMLYLIHCIFFSIACKIAPKCRVTRASIKGKELKVGVAGYITFVFFALLALATFVPIAVFSIRFDLFLSWIGI